jgi:transposase
MHRMCWKEHKEVEFVPAHLSITNYKQAVYSCRNCENEAVGNPIVAAPMPPLAFPGSLASPSLVAEIMGRKYVDGTPLYRQEPLWLAQGLELNRQTMANWVMRGAHDWLSIIFDRMHELLLCRDAVNADETTMQVLREDGRAAQTLSYLWQYRSGRDGPPIVMFEYQPTRSGEHPKRFLKNFTGDLQTDGWQAYEKVLEDREPDLPVTLNGCWSHARRYFYDAILTLPEKDRQLGTSAAHVGLNYCNKIFEIEAELHDCSNEERLAGRIEFSKPVVERMHAWILRTAPGSLPKSPLGKAFTYHVNQWQKLVRFLTDGSLQIDNNSSERAIRNVVTGRKNWLFATSPRGAQATAIVYSIVVTAKENHLDPRTYLKFLFEQLPDVGAGDNAAIDKLLPWAQEVQTELAVKARDPRPLQNWKRRQRLRQRQK